MFNHLALTRRLLTPIAALLLFLFLTILYLPPLPTLLSPPTFPPHPTPEGPRTRRLPPGKDDHPATEPGAIGTFLQITHSPPTPPNSGIPNCEYPILIHVTPDEHCTGALTLYGSIVRNVLLQPEWLKNKTCVHFTYVDEKVETIEEMYKWKPTPNPYTTVPDCALLSSPSYNTHVPISFHALTPILKPPIMDARANWIAALNKIHSWAFDLYPRILLLDADSIVVQDLALIFEESDPMVTIAGAVDQFWSCLDRARINGGMILLRPSRYFHTIAAELLYDPSASCLTGKWQQSEQELLNCICGYTYDERAPIHPLHRAFRCAIMPIYNSVWPRDYGCSDANVVPMRSIHFTAAPKPWKVEEGLLGERFDTGYWKCVRDVSRKAGEEGLKRCSIPGLEVTRKVIMEGHFVVGNA